MSGHRFANIFGALLHALIVGVAERSGLVSMRKRMCLRHVGDIASRTHDGVHQARRSICADVRFHPEVPVNALLRSVHLRITLAILVLGRRWRGDQRGINNGPLAHHQTLFGKVSVDRIEDLASQIFCFEQVTKLEQRRRVWRRLTAGGFADSQEFRDLYGAAPSHAEVVALFYRNVLDREPDGEGYAFWLDVLDSGRASVAGVLASFSESNENVWAVAELIGEGIAYQPWGG